jgi:hypothetical protein
MGFRDELAIIGVPARDDATRGDPNPEVVVAIRRGTRGSTRTGGPGRRRLRTSDLALTLGSLGLSHSRQPLLLD